MPFLDEIGTAQFKDWIKGRYDETTLVFTTLVESADWHEDNTYDEYPYAYDILNLKLTTNYTPTVIFALAESSSGNYAPVCRLSTGKITIYAKEIPENNFIIPTVIAEYSFGLGNITDGGTNSKTNLDDISNKIDDLSNEVITKQTISDIVTKSPVKMIAHRGWWGTQYPDSDITKTQIIPENSYESLRYCANKKFFGMEMDVQRAADGTFWISHNNSLSSTTDSTATISGSTEAELREIVLTNSNCGIPKLSEFMVACRRYNIIPVIELKSETITVASIPSFMNILESTGVIKSCFVMSYSSDLLKAVFEHNPNVPIQLITNSFSKTIIDNAFKNIAPIVGFDVAISAVTSELCNYVHSKGSYIIGWTVSGEESLVNATKLGCDYVETENTINRAIPEMRDADPVFISAYPGIEHIHSSPIHTLNDTRVEYGTHNFGEGKKCVLLKANFEPTGLITDPENESYGKYTRAHGVTLYAIPEDALYCKTTLDINTYKWNIMCLDGNGNGCTDYPWGTAPTHRIYNTVNNGNPPKWGYIYAMRVDGKGLSEADKKAIEAATYTIETDWAGSVSGTCPVILQRHGNQVHASVHTSVVVSALVNGGTLCTGLPKLKVSTVNADTNYNTIILHGNSGNVTVCAFIDSNGVMKIDYVQGTVPTSGGIWLRGETTYTCGDYWETGFN